MLSSSRRRSWNRSELRFEHLAPYILTVRHFPERDGHRKKAPLRTANHKDEIRGQRPHPFGGDRLRRVRAVRAPALHPGARRQARRHGRHPPARVAGRGRPVRGRERRRRRRVPPARRRGRGLHRHPAVPPPPAGDGRPGGRQARDRREAAGPDRRARPTSWSPSPGSGTGCWSPT